MSRRTVNLTDDLYDYILSVSLREPDVLARLREETSKLEWAGMQISPEQGQLMRLLNEVLGTHRALEVGTFTGYSSICIALAMPEDGKLLCCDTSVEWTDIARRYWDEAGVAQRIELRLGEALGTLDELIAGGEGDTYDFAFVDADKENYELYYERCLSLIRPGGLIAIDNVLWGGSVARAGDQRPGTTAIRRLNERLHRDERVFLSLIPIGDGLTLVRKR
jgi:predicted O-methyltransferase YrrM